VTERGPQGPVRSGEPPGESIPEEERSAGTPEEERSAGTRPSAARRSIERFRRRRQRLTPLPVWIRIGLWLVGWLLVLVGVAGLVLPGIQGVLTIFLGAAVLSLVSELIYEWLGALLHRWPGVWRRVEGFRLKVHRRLRGRRQRRRRDGEGEG